MLVAVEALAPLPAEEHVGHRLIHPLPPDDTLAVVLVLARAEIGLEHRRLRLLHLEHERVLAGATGEQKDPGARADASDTDDLAGHVDELVGTEQVTPVGVEAREVLVEQVANVIGLVARIGRVVQVGEPDEQRRDAAKPRLAVDTLGELADGPQAGLLPRPRERLRERDPALFAEPAAEATDELTRIDPLVPHVEVADLGEPAHRLAILTDTRDHKLRAAIRRQPDVASRRSRRSPPSA